VVREWGHQFIYDPETLRRTLELAGFTMVQEFKIGDKTDPVFETAEFRKRALHGIYGEDVWLTNNFGSMAFEAVR
jgi:hypothetical protein